jgi:hypothetical protein
MANALTLHTQYSCDDEIPCLMSFLTIMSDRVCVFQERQAGMSILSEEDCNGNDIVNAFEEMKKKFIDVYGNRSVIITRVLSM